MVKKRASSTPRKRKNTVNNSRLIRSLVSLVWIILSILGLFKFGIVGKTFDNIYRIFVGDSYPVLLIISIFVGAFIIATGRIPVMTPKRNFGFLFVYLGTLIILHGIFFSSMSLYHNYNLVTWNTLAADMTQVSVDGSVGGGMIGSYLYSFFMPMFSSTGTYFVTALMIFIGILMLFNVTMKQVSIVTTNILVKIKHAGLKLKEIISGHYSNYVDQRAADKKQVAQTQPTVEKKKQNRRSNENSKISILLPIRKNQRPKSNRRILNFISIYPNLLRQPKNQNQNLAMGKSFQSPMELMVRKIKTCQIQSVTSRVKQPTTVIISCHRLIF
jgi:hypothetical protein